MRNIGQEIVEGLKEIEKDCKKIDLPPIFSCIPKQIETGSLDHLKWILSKESLCRQRVEYIEIIDGG